MGGTPNDGWDLNRARWEKAETGPDTAATPCNVIESHSVVQIHYSSQFLFISGARLHCIAEHLHRVLPWLYFSAVNTTTVASSSSNNQHVSTLQRRETYRVLKPGIFLLQALHISVTLPISKVHTI